MGLGLRALYGFNIVQMLTSLSRLDTKMDQ